MPVATSPEITEKTIESRRVRVPTVCVRLAVKIKIQIDFGVEKKTLSNVFKPAVEWFSFSR